MSEFDAFNLGDIVKEAVTRVLHRAESTIKDGDEISESCRVVSQFIENWDWDQLNVANTGKFSDGD